MQFSLGSSCAAGALVRISGLAICDCRPPRSRSPAVRDRAPYNFTIDQRAHGSHESFNEVPGGDSEGGS
jgi:hypothetical protein